MSTPSVPYSSDTPGRPAHLLLVEDDRSMRAFLTSYLGQHYAITAVANGAEALAQLQTKPERFVGILTDLEMPQLNGLQLIQQVRAGSAQTHLPILVVSGETTSTQRIACLEAGANDYLTKPFNPEELRLRLQRLIYSQPLA